MVRSPVVYLGLSPCGQRIAAQPGPRANRASTSCRCHTAAHERNGCPSANPGSYGRPVNGGEVRDTWFFRWARNGYEAPEVGDLLRRVADALDAGQPAGPLIENARFRCRRATGCDIDAVDWFFEELRRQEDRSEAAGASSDPWRDLAVVNQFTGAMPGYPAETSARSSWAARRRHRAERRRYLSESWKNREEEFARARRDFGRQPGLHLRWVWIEPDNRSELRAADEETLASLYRKSLSTGGTKFTLKTLSAPSASLMSAAAGTTPPAVAEIVAGSQRDHNGHFAAEPTWRDLRVEAGDVRELLDETGAPILYVCGRNYEYRAWARVTFPDQASLRFLVRGTRPANAIMTAVDQAGNKVARYRLSGYGEPIPKTEISWFPGGLDRPRPGTPVEITVHPDWALTDELALTILISAPWLGAYFDRPYYGL